MLDEIRRQILVCTRCALSQGRTNAVPGEGPADAAVMLVGEAPGQQEDRFGRPFVGPAGHFLNELLEHAGLSREDVFITNIVKCRPPGNRTPKPEEIAACNDYLIGQIAAISPKVICTLGSPALRTLIDERASISRVHAQPRKKSGILYVPLYHPAAALHRQDLRETLIKDMARLRDLL